MIFFKTTIDVLLKISGNLAISSLEQLKTKSLEAKLGELIFNFSGKEKSILSDIFEFEKKLFNLQSTKFFDLSENYYQAPKGNDFNNSDYLVLSNRVILTQLKYDYRKFLAEFKLGNPLSRFSQKQDYILYRVDDEIVSQSINSLTALIFRKLKNKMRIKELIEIIKSELGISDCEKLREFICDQVKSAFLAGLVLVNKENGINLLPDLISNQVVKKNNSISKFHILSSKIVAYTGLAGEIKKNKNKHYRLHRVNNSLIELKRLFIELGMQEVYETRLEELNNSNDKEKLFFEFILEMNFFIKNEFNYLIFYQ